jgi:hypothetical protein
MAACLPLMRRQSNDTVNATSVSAEVLLPSPSTSSFEMAIVPVNVISPCEDVPCVRALYWMAPVAPSSENWKSPLDAGPLFCAAAANVKRRDAKDTLRRTIRIALLPYCLIGR